MTTKASAHALQLRFACHSMRSIIVIERVVIVETLEASGQIIIVDVLAIVLLAVGVLGVGIVASDKLNTIMMGILDIVPVLIVATEPTGAGDFGGGLGGYQVLRRSGGGLRHGDVCRPPGLLGEAAPFLSPQIIGSSGPQASERLFERQVRVSLAESLEVGPEVVGGRLVEDEVQTPGGHVPAVRESREEDDGVFSHVWVCV